MSDLYIVDSEAAGILSSSRSLHWLPLGGGVANRWFGALGPPAKFPLLLNVFAMKIQLQNESLHPLPATAHKPSPPAPSTNPGASRAPGGRHLFSPFCESSSLGLLSQVRLKGSVCSFSHSLIH